jgi:hypothetical protein
MKINGVEVVNGKCNVPLITFDVPTISAEVFPKQVVKKCIMKDKALKEKLKSGTFFGELRARGDFASVDVSRFFRIEPDKIVMRITSLYCADKNLRGDIELISPLSHALLNEIEYHTAYRIFNKEDKDKDNNMTSFVLVSFDLMVDKRS